MPIEIHCSSRPVRLARRVLLAAVAVAGACGLVAGPVQAAPDAPAGARPSPEIVRPAVAPQAVGAAHTLRTIPEACTRLEGRFTGDAARPYALAAVRTRPNCQPRARFVDAAQAKPSTAAGWVLNDEIRVPNSACPRQRAIVQVWRRPVDVAPPQLDAQGRARVYLQDARQAAQADRIAPVPRFAAQVAVEGGCG